MGATKHNFTGEFSAKEYEFESTCAEVLHLFEKSEDILRAKRNTLKVINLHGKSCVVKTFKIPKFPQNYSYGLAAKSKAKKSYNNAHRLIELGFQTPAPIGYFENRTGGKLTISYYLCAYAEGIETLDQIWRKDETLEPQLLKSFTKYCVDIHNKGILHRDFNPTNILVSKTAGDYQFSLVDINRITWYEKLTLPKAMASLSRFPFSREVTEQMIKEYAKCAGVEVAQCKKFLEISVRKTERYFRNKRRLRKIFPKK